MNELDSLWRWSFCKLAVREQIRTQDKKQNNTQQTNGKKQRPGLVTQCQLHGALYLLPVWVSWEHLVCVHIIEQNCECGWYDKQCLCSHLFNVVEVDLATAGTWKVEVWWVTIQQNVNAVAWKAPHRLWNAA